jgi:hypothetical protein
MKIKKFLLLCILLTFFVFLSAGWDFIQQKEPTSEEKVIANTAKLTAKFSEGKIEDMVTTLYNKDAVIFLPREDWLKQKGAPKEILGFWAPLMKMFPDGKVKGHEMIIKFWTALKEIGVKKIVFETVNLSIVNEVGNQTFKYSFIPGEKEGLKDPGGDGGGIWVHRLECTWEMITQYF